MRQGKLQILLAVRRLIIKLLVLVKFAPTSIWLKLKAIRQTPPLTASIQAPAFGKNFPADVPIASRGAPIPMLKANKAMPPIKASPVFGNIDKCAN